MKNIINQIRIQRWKWKLHETSTFKNGKTFRKTNNTIHLTQFRNLQDIEHVMKISVWPIKKNKNVNV